MSKTMSKALLVSILGLSVAGATTLLPAVSFAGEEDAVEEKVFPRRGAHMRGPAAGRPGVLRALQRLDLDESQREAIRSMVEAGREAGEPLREELSGALSTLRELYQDESAGDQALEAGVDAVFAAREALREHRIDIKEQIREVLSPRQQAQLMLMTERRGKGPRGMDGHPGRRGPGPRR